MGEQSAPEKVSKETNKLDNSIITTQIGVWKFSTIKQPRFDLRRRWDRIVSGLQLFWRLVAEVSAISPTLFVLFVLSKVWEGVRPVVMLHLSSTLLHILEASIRDRESSTLAILVAIVNRLTCVVFVAISKWWTNKYNPLFQSRVIQYYEMYLMQTRLNIDLSSAQDPESQAFISPNDAWDAFDKIVSLWGNTLTSLSQFTLILHAARSSGGPVFTLLCLARPLYSFLFSEDVWSKMWLINLDHKDYQRMQALSALTTDTYRQDFITGNLKDHIMKEYEKAKNNLRDTCTDDYWLHLHRSSSPVYEIVSSISGDLPTVYCAANAIINPSKFSIASIAILDHSSTILRQSLYLILHSMRTLHRDTMKLKNLYALSEKLSKTTEGDVPYPSPRTSTDGMSFELRNVVFDYPGSKNKSPALKDVSLNIKPGQLVVIVGANGSGKSTLIKLLTRLYDPTSGSLLIDDMPAQDYRPMDVRHTMASFTQDHNLYPLSLYENIAFGNVARSTDAAAVAAAAEQGGATGLVAKFVDGLDTVLDPRIEIYTMNMPDDPEHPLKKRMKKLSKKIDISGGEKQRIVAARTFMQLNSGHVTFVAVDEPSSALDPEAEYQMFNRLIASRAGKTMAFVTHRFGHLTKHADLIICMKDGGVAESGSHEELMKLDGEYTKLYQIQANAFSNK